MTDLPNYSTSVPSRLGVTARMQDDRFWMDLWPQPETLHRGLIRASVVSFLVDVVAGIGVDDDPDTWSLTTDMTVRMRPVRDPDRISGVSEVLRRGGRSVTCSVDLFHGNGEPLGAGAIGFARVPRREGDPPKPMLSPEMAVEYFQGLPDLSRPLRDEAGIEVLDASEGIVQVTVTPELRNPAGTMQGAMVALVAEAAVEELVEARCGGPAVVVDLDIRYLAQVSVGPVRSECRMLGESPLDPVEVRLVDTSAGRVTTLVHARAVQVPHS